MNKGSILLAFGDVIAGTTDGEEVQDVTALHCSRKPQWYACPAETLDEDEAQILAYLNMTHQRHGTYLIKTDEKGAADIVFRKPDPLLINALSSSDFSKGPKPVDPALMAMLGIPSFGLMDVLDEARDVQVTVGTKQFRAAQCAGAHL
ncbi:hypothetical protein BDZ45DRAFT_745810 [Acephala macrosclerotiorum]|nr:hypothetical protein BDZ45DRAFT_745810 [Acephala macrosclerotiorum]